MSASTALTGVKLKAITFMAVIELALQAGYRTISTNHARLASTDFGRHAHFGGFSFSGDCA